MQQLTRGALSAGVELRDLGEHRLRDLLEPEHVFQILHPDLPTEFPPLQSLAARPHNLPRQPTPFLGREHEVGEISALLRQPEVQLLTLTGPGGTGKTRLALQAAAELLDEFSDGVVFVPLAALADPALVPAAIATALGVREEGGQPLLERLTTHLANRHLLLVIDNWEHLLAGASVLGELLRAAPQLTVLATSRAPLHLQAEREYPVPPLALPRRKPPPSLAQLSQSEAVRLFIARAQAVRPDFSVDNTNAAAVAEICRRLDGLPLAIELAAARLRLLPLQAMLNRLEQRLPLLTGGARDAPARQQTLRQTIAWSHDLLQPEEQILFRRLAVFMGGFTFEAAEAVANPEGDADVFAGLERLCDHSLLRQEEGGGGEPRFTMLETIREFGREQLAERGEREVARDRHAAFFLSLAEEAELHLHGVAGNQTGWIARIDAEFDNLRAAIIWALNQQDGTRPLRIIVALEGYLSSRFKDREVGPWVEAALALAPDAPPLLRAGAYLRLVAYAVHTGDGAAALAAAQEALVQAEVTGDPFAIGRALIGVGWSWEVIGEPARCLEALERAVPLLRQSDRPDFLALALSMLGQACIDSGELAAAQALLDEALSI
jgi:predicted ATPase